MRRKSRADEVLRPSLTKQMLHVVQLVHDTAADSDIQHLGEIGDVRVLNARLGFAMATLHLLTAMYSMAHFSEMAPLLRFAARDMPTTRT